MKRILFAIVLLISFLQVSKSQVIRLENGVAISHIKDGFERDIYTYQNSLGLDYLDRDWYYLSSNVGYYRAGGEIYVAQSINDLFLQALYIDYLTFNTTFNAKVNLSGKCHIYAGVGPRLNVKVSHSAGNNIDLESYNEEFLSYIHLNTLDFGLKTTIGFNYDLGKMALGISASYLPSFTKALKKEEGIRRPGKNSTFTFGLLLGYKI